MNTPLVLIERRLPRELVNIIQTYIRNDVVHEALRCHLQYLIYEQELYIKYIYDTQVRPVCYCHRLSPKYLRKYDFCDHCRWFENSVEFSDNDEYKSVGYIACLNSDNEQQYKLLKWD